MITEAIGQATVIRMLLKANEALRNEFLSSTAGLLARHGIPLDAETAKTLTLAVGDEFTVGQVHVVFSEDIEDQRLVTR